MYTVHFYYLHPKILKQLAATIAPTLQLIFQSVDVGETLTDWKTANVNPIY